jgi:microcystin-dependent protein
MEGTIGEIRMFAGTFAPRSWAFCSGQLMAIAQNTALFSILGTTYGGNGQTTFALPDLRGRGPVGVGQGPGLPLVDLGQVGGEPTVTLLTTQVPAHNHTLLASTGLGDASTPVAGKSLGVVTDATANPLNAYATAAPSVALAPQSIGNTGGSQPHNNLPPFLGMNYIICLEGIFPSRN